jgi:hypothetical protein
MGGLLAPHQKKHKNHKSATSESDDETELVSMSEATPSHDPPEVFSPSFSLRIQLLFVLPILRSIIQDLYLPILSESNDPEAPVYSRVEDFYRGGERRTALCRSQVLGGFASRQSRLVKEIIRLILPEEHKRTGRRTTGVDGGSGRRATPEAEIAGMAEAQTVSTVTSENS